MPFPYAFSATCRSCMLCNKYRMPLHWCLFSIIRDNCRCFAFCNKISGMLPDRIYSFFINIIDVFLFENCFETWNFQVSETVVCTILLLSMIFTLKFFCFPIAFHIFIIRPFFHYFYKTLYFDRHFRTKGTLKMPFGVYPKKSFQNTPHFTGSGVPA